jgi:hypothetical protein
MTSIETYLNSVKASFDDFRFVSGDCHNLAVALHKQFKGELCAIIREEFDESDELYSTTYSHMLFIDENGIEWDIDGSGADERWIEQWPDDGDEDGHTSEFNYVSLTLDDLPEFLAENDCEIDETLVNELLNVSEPVIMNL